jgi:hypothetical protein
MSANNPNTQLQVINKALVLCGANTVGSITDGSPNANALNNVYELALQEVLSECNWNFAKYRVFLPSVSTLVTTSTLQYLYSQESFIYALPTFGVVRIWCVNPQTAIWREVNGFILSDTAGLGVEYTNYDDNVADYPSYFLQAFMDKLCADIGFVIINSPPIAKAFVDKYEISIQSAISKNSQTGTQQCPQDSFWTNSKYYDGGGSTDAPWGAVSL